jgi:alpha-glucuronidase
MWPMGWEEFHWRTNASSAVGPGPKGAIIEAWSKYKAADVVKAGYRAVEADGGRFYLNHLHPTENQWLDIGENIETVAETELMLGGAFRFIGWTDDDCWLCTACWLHTVAIVLAFLDPSNKLTNSLSFICM